jgi:hypothetical protein
VRVCGNDLRGHDRVSPVGSYADRALGRPRHRPRGSVQSGVQDRLFSQGLMGFTDLLYESAIAGGTVRIWDLQLGE